MQKFKAALAIEAFLKHQTFQINLQPHLAWDEVILKFVWERKFLFLRIWTYFAAIELRYGRTYNLYFPAPFE